MDFDLLKRGVQSALDNGADYADVRYHSTVESAITAENGLMKSYESNVLAGIGIRVLVGGAWGFASTNRLDGESLKEKGSEAVRIARAVQPLSRSVGLMLVKGGDFESKVSFKTDPDDISPDKKTKIVLEASKAAKAFPHIESTVSRLATTKDVRLFLSSEKTKVTSQIVMTGFAHTSIAKVEGRLQRVPYSASRCAGFEYIEACDWSAFSRDVSRLAVEAAKADPPKAGTYPVVVDPELVGLLLHEALGHASEADLVTTGESVLKGRIGLKIASEKVTVYDDGSAEGGYIVPFDDEGVAKARTTIVEKGVLKGFLHSRETSKKLAANPTGNARAQDFAHQPIVRQTNFYMQPGDYDIEELIEDIDFGFYLRGRGTLGGQVDVAGGTFTFRAGPSQVIEKGELRDMIRDVTLTGMVLDSLKTVDAVGKDFQVRTSIFGGCGKDGQLARVGDGGPHVRFRKMTIGGQ